MEEKATLAGGCFWCIESAFMTLEGVISTRTGYTGGHLPNPTYEEVSEGTTGHYEAVEILYDPEKVTFAQILDIFWKQIDPLDDGGQFYDRGPQYRTVIFYHDWRQKAVAERSRDEIAALFSKPIKTQILPASEFYIAEEIHQAYCQKRPDHYEAYRKGHERELRARWKDIVKKRPSQKELKEKLTPLQYWVTQEEGTEPPFDNAYCDNKGEGIYVDIISGEPLFLSSDKFESRSGWPSFTKPIEKKRVTEKSDYKIGQERTEVRSASSDSHLGHVFPDGPDPTGLRYCINSAALRFIPKEKLEEEGYGEYLSYFK